MVAAILLVLLILRLMSFYALICKGGGRCAHEPGSVMGQLSICTDRQARIIGLCNKSDEIGDALHGRVMIVSAR